MGFEMRNYVNGYGNGVMYDYEERENGNGNGNGSGGDDSPRMIHDSKVFSLSPSSSSSSSSPRKYIEHHVSKLDTLAGIAIRYGVEVADIKKMNNLVTDLQMFALKTLRIPLPGRHPPSPCLSNGHSSAGSIQTPSSHTHSDFLESFQSLKLTPDRNLSPAMNSLQNFYGLNGRRNSSEGYEANEGFSTTSSFINPPLNQQRRTRSAANSLRTDEDESTNEIDSYYHNLIKKLNIHPQKTEDPRTPEKILKPETTNGSWFSAITGKGLALRTKTPSRTNLSSEMESSGENGFQFTIGEFTMDESSAGVRKSFSTPSFQDQDKNASVSIWSLASWSLTPDLQAAFASPIFDGLPKPITGRRGKAARD